MRRHVNKPCINTSPFFQSELKEKKEELLRLNKKVRYKKIQESNLNQEQRGRQWTYAVIKKQLSLLLKVYMK